MSLGCASTAVVADFSDMSDAGDLSDEALLHGIEARDQAALRVLFDRYAPIALSLAHRVLRDPQMAEDVVQDAFLSVWERPDNYQGDRGSVRSFLFAIVHNRAVDRVRRESTQQRRMRTEAAYAQDPEPGVDELVTDAAEIVLRRKQVRTALAEIPAEQRNIIELMYFDGLTQVQVAERLELPLGTVKSRTLLGMRKLRAALAAVEMERPR